MPKKFITEQDIEKLAQQGVKSLEITPDVVLTDLAFEKARRLGIEMVNQMDTPACRAGAPLYFQGPADGGFSQTGGKTGGDGEECSGGGRDSCACPGPEPDSACSGDEPASPCCQPCSGC